MTRDEAECDAWLEIEQARVLYRFHASCRCTGFTGLISTQPLPGSTVGGLYGADGVISTNSRVEVRIVKLQNGVERIVKRQGVVTNFDPGANQVEIDFDDTDNTADPGSETFDAAEAYSIQEGHDLQPQSS